MTSADYFLLLDGIPGESPDRAHPNEIEAFGFSWGETLTSTIGHGGGMGVGKVAMTPLVVQAATSIATPHLMVTCASGRQLSQARLSVRRVGPDAGSHDYLVITLKEVLVSSLKVYAGESDQRPTDEISLTFEDITIRVSQQRPDGSLGAAETAEWNLRTHSGHE
jgi:type VI secretion system secreted protein Hcp